MYSKTVYAVCFPRFTIKWPPSTSFYHVDVHFALSSSNRLSVPSIKFSYPSAPFLRKTLFTSYFLTPARLVSLRFLACCSFGTLSSRLSPHFFHLSHSSDSPSSPCWRRGLQFWCPPQLLSYPSLREFSICLYLLLFHVGSALLQPVLRRRAFPSLLVAIEYFTAACCVFCFTLRLSNSYSLLPRSSLPSRRVPLSASRESKWFS